MHRRKLGKTGLEVAAVGLGCMGMSQSYGAGNDEESIRTLRRALDLGVTLIDTADVYGKGANEALVGRVVRERRTDVVLATKFGLVPPPGGGPATDVDGRPERARPCCEASLQRLGIDVIDLYYLHRVDPKVPIEESVGALASLVQAGKVRHIGLSEAAPSTIRRAQTVHPIAALQSEWSLWTRDLEHEIAPVCRELGIGLVPFSPLGRGFLTGRIQDLGDLPADDRRRQHPRFQDRNFEHNLALIRRIEEIAKEKGVKPGQLVLAWLLAQGDDIIPIPGTKRRPYLEENLGALGIQLTASDREVIDEAMPPGAAAGSRYPEPQMKAVQL